MKKIYLLILPAILFSITVFAQPGAVGNNNLSGAPFLCTPFTAPSGFFFQARIQANQSSSSASWEFPQNCTFPGDVWRPYAAGTAAIPFNTTIAPVGGTGSALYNSGNGGAAGTLSPTTDGNYYTFNVQNVAAPTNAYMAVLETNYNPVTITAVSNTTPANASNAVLINCTASSAPAAGEYVYVRYSTDGYVTSALAPFTFTGTAGQALIPCFAGGTVVNYYVMSSNRTAAQIAADVLATGSQVSYDMLTLNLNNNGGTNYSYTQGSGTNFGGIYSTPSACYATVSAFVTALNAGTVTAPVTMYAIGGSPTETATAGGITITSTGTAANPIILQKFGTGSYTIQASSALTVGTLHDAIFELVGTDYITIDGFTLQENAANTINTPAGSNNMTEWGIALLKASTTDGAQNNTIQNNTISLNRTYTNTFGIYSNIRHTTTSITATTDVTNNTTGPNHSNKVYGNTISNVNMGIAFIGSNVAANQDAGNDIGGSMAATGNTITNWGGAAQLSSYTANTGTSYCIFLNHQTGDNISYNTITSAAVTPTVTFRGILKDYTQTAPTGTFTSTISYNTVTLTNAATSGNYRGIEITGMGTLSTATVNITNNTILNMTMSGASSSTTIIGIINFSAPGLLNLNNNAVRGCTSTSTTGGFIGIQNNGAVVTTLNINNNQLGDGVTGPVTFSTGTSNSIIGISNTNGAVGASISISGNTVDGIICVTASAVTCISNTGGTGTNITINSNSILNTVVSGTTASTITTIINSIAAASLTVNANTVRGHSSASTTGGFVGIQNTGAVTGTININTNQIGNASGPAVTMTGATNSSVWGISNTNGVAATNLNITNNTMERFNTFTSFTVIGVINSGSPGGIININDNSFGNATANFVTVSGAQNAAISAIQNQQAGAGSTLNINNNNVDRISGVSNISNTYIIYNSSSNPTTININNNNLGSTTGSLVSYSAPSTGGIYGILNFGAPGTLNANFNKIDGISVVTSGNIAGFYNAANVTTAINVENNSFGTTSGTFINCSGAQTSTIYSIYVTGGTAATAISIRFNDLRGIVHAVTASAGHLYLIQGGTVLSSIISNNTFTNLAVNTSGSVTLITRSGNMASGATSVCSNNSIVTGFSKTGSGGTFYSYVSNAASVNGATMTETGNNFSNVTVAGSTNIVMWNNEDGASVSNGPTKTITGNTFNNINAGTGTVDIIKLGYGAATNCSNNTITNVSSSGAYINCITNNYNDGQGTVTYANNTINNISSTGSVYGIYGSFPSVPTTNINNNTITNLSSTGANGAVAGIYPVNGQAINVYDNQVNNLSVSGSGTATIFGMAFSGGNTVNVYNNNIHTLSATSSLLTGAPAVRGMSVNGGTTVNVYNNFLANFTAPNASLDSAIAGMFLFSATPSTTANLYYNSIYLNAGSTGIDFGTAGIHHLADATATTGALNMINNIIVNTSTPNGTGKTAAYRRSDATLTNFALTSDYNLFYAGTPSASRLIFYDGTNSDQTLAAYQARVSTRDASSISLMPTFTSATDLHLTNVNCRINGRGVPIGSVTDDIDAAVRSATTPDIGADEFNPATSITLAGTAGSMVCEDRTVAIAGTIYTANSCDLIARILPSGADPVAGKVNVCVTLDATQQTFNGEPYVQRHFDMEPTTGNQTTTSATITLYFTNAEFVQYNINNPAWPQMPTSTLGNADPNRANVKVTQFHGAATTNPSSPGNYPGSVVLITPGAANVFWNGVYWQVTFTVTGFSGFYVHTNNFNAPLPIVVNYLTGKKQGNDHLLNWKVTCTSTPRATMTLERSGDARNFSGIYTITADAARCQQPFDHTDASPLKGMNYYRLKIVDADGRITYSTTVALLNAVKGFDIISIAPNPVVSNNFKLNVASATAGKMELVIFDMQGRLVNRQTLSLIAGFNSLPVNVANLAPGTYTIKGSMSDDQSKVIRFVKQ